MNAQPPKPLQWTESGWARSVATLAAYVALAGAILLGVRGQAYISCVGSQQQAAAVRTAAIAKATDAERAAQRRVLTAIGDHAQVDATRAAALAAYDATDTVRKAYPAPPVKRC